MSGPKPEAGEFGKNTWAPGERTDGSIDIMTEDEARIAITQRDADEAAFDAMLAGDEPESDEDREFREASQGDGDDEDA